MTNSSASARVFTRPSCSAPMFGCIGTARSQLCISGQLNSNLPRAVDRAAYPSITGGPKRNHQQCGPELDYGKGGTWY